MGSEMCIRDSNIPFKRVRKSRDFLTYNAFIGLAEAEQLVEDFANLADKDPIQMNLVLKAARGKNPDIVTYDEAMSNPNPKLDKLGSRLCFKRLISLKPRNAGLSALSHQRPQNLSHALGY